MREWKLGYRPELNGLRAIAVVMVVLGHARFPLFKWAGAVGVTLFFTLSGFLITALMLEEHRKSGTVSLRGFWRRRAVRLLPAVMVMLLVVLVVPTGLDFDLQKLGIVAAYGANWWMVAGRDLSPVGHTWSLAVEEQFYIVWPLVVVAVLRWTPKRLGVVAVVGAIASMVWRVWLWKSTGSVERVYYGTDTNVGGMLAGAALAWAASRGHNIRVGRVVAVLALLLAVGVGGLLTLTPYTWFDGYDFGYIYAPIITVIAGVGLVAHLATQGWGWLGWRPLVYVGGLSYGLYLWHAVVFNVWEGYAGQMTGNLAQTAGLVAVAWLFTWASWRWVEQPMTQRWRASRSGRAKVHATGTP